MNKNRLHIVLILLILPFLINGQTASIENDLSTIINEETTAKNVGIKSSMGDPITGWPECEVPTGLTLYEDKDNYKIIWDQTIKQNFEYEVIVENSLGMRTGDVSIVYSNEFKIGKKIVKTEGVEKIKVRRKCNPYLNNYFYSDWVEISFYDQNIECNTCDDISKKITASKIGECVYLHILPYCGQNNYQDYYYAFPFLGNQLVKYFENSTLISFHESELDPNYINSTTFSISEFNINDIQIVCEKSLSPILFESPPPPCSNPQNPEAVCPINQFVKGAIQGNDLVLSTENITEPSFNAMISGNGISKVEFRIDAIENYNVVDTWTVELYDASASYFNIEYWNETLGGFGTYGTYTVTTIITTEDGSALDCLNSFDLPIENALLCDFFSLLLWHKESNSELVFDFEDLDPDYYVDALQDLGYTEQQAQMVYSNEILSLSFNLSFSNGGAYQTVSYTFQNPQSLILKDLNYTFDNLNLSGFTGNLEVEYQDKDGKYHTCLVGPIEYEGPTSELPDYNCGEEYTLPSYDNSNIKTTLYSGELVEAAGMTFEVIEVNGTNSFFSGSGKLANPFTDKAIQVTFAGVQINEDNEMVAGSVNGVTGDPSTYPGFIINPDTISIGGDICRVDLPPEGQDEDGFDTVTGLNDRGFGQDSLFYPGGTKYDENGFDFEGIYEDGSEYDPWGCNYLGLDENGEPCFRNETEVTQYLDSMKTEIPTMIPTILTSVVDSLNLLLQGQDCDAKRANLNTLFTSVQAIFPNIQREHIFGDGDKYFNPNMSEEFASEPKPVVLQSEDRDANIVALENEHVELYKCDKLNIVYSEMINAISKYEVADLQALIEAEMNNLTAYQVGKFKEDPNLFLEWLKATIGKIIGDQEDDGIGFIPEMKKKNSSPYDMPFGNSAYSYTASIDELTNVYSNSPMTEDEAYWLFKQGFQEIGRVNRAYYLEELYRQNVMVGGGDDPTMTTLPVRLNKIIDGSNYDIYLDNLQITPTGGTIDAYFIFEEPNSGKRIVLQATNITFGTGGVTGNTKLSLLTAVEIRLSNSVLLRIMPSPETFVSWGCDGFEAFGLDAQVEVCRELITPLDPATLLPVQDPDERYTISIQLELAKWSELYFEINPTTSNTPLKPFAVTGYENIKWTLSDLVVDFSDMQSPVISQIPTDYTSPHFVGGQFTANWKGVYLGNLSATLKNQFDSGGTPLTIAVNEVIIDDTGFTGEIQAQNILDIDKGNAGGWPISIDDISIIFLQNQIRGGSLGGQIKVSTFQDGLSYNAAVYPGGVYDFTVIPNAANRMDMLLADVTLYENSSINLRYENDSFKVKAILNGKIDMDSDGDLSLNFPDITFEEFEVSNISPYFSPGVWSMSNSVGAKFAGFGVNLDNIKPIKDGTEKAGMHFDLNLDLVEKLGINATGGFNVMGTLDYDDQGRQRWVHEDTELTTLGVDVTFSAGRIRGYLDRFNGDNKYGTGFRGYVGMQFKGLGEVECLAHFGKTNFNHNEDYKYFFVDAQVEFATGIPAGILTIDGFTGGLSYHMDRVENATMGNNPMTGTSSFPSIGQSLSGNIYEPNVIRGLGVKAGAMLSLTGNKPLFNGKVALDMVFNANDEATGKGGGLNKIGFEGIGQFMNVSLIGGNTTEQDSTAKPNITASLSAHLRLTYNFDEDEFHGRFISFLNTPGNVIVGAGDDGKLVSAEVYFGQRDWWVYIGTPEDRCGIRIQIPLIGAGVELLAYLDLGTKVPEMPDIPSNVRSIASKIKRNEAIRSMGAGFAFGASLDVEAGINLGIASGKFTAGGGFDVLIRNYGDAYCLGNSPGDEIGINGWYGKGQMWAYCTGEIKVLGVNVISAGLAAALQAQMPNPFYAQATVGVRIKLLFVTVKKNFKLALGDHCIIAGASDNGLGMEVITSISPPDGSQKMSVDEKPEIFFALPLDKKLEMPKMVGNGNDVYEAKLKYVKVIDGNGYEIPYTPVYADPNNKTSLKIDPDAWFYSNDSITIEVEVDVFRNGTLDTTEVRQAGFRVGDRIDYILPDNIASSYPVDGMNNFYKKEYNRYEGYIQLLNGIPELIYDVPDGMDLKVRFTGSNNSVITVELDYNPIGRTITFPMDPNIFVNGERYQLDVVYLPNGESIDFPANPNVNFENFTDKQNISTAFGESSIGMSGNNSEESEKFIEKVLCRLYFRVSNHNTLLQKLSSGLQSTTSASGLKYYKNIVGEPFDQIEFNSDHAGLMKINFHTDYVSSGSGSPTPTKSNDEAGNRGPNDIDLFEIANLIYLNKNNLRPKNFPCEWIISLTGDPLNFARHSGTNQIPNVSENNYYYYSIPNTNQKIDFSFVQNVLFDYDNLHKNIEMCIFNFQNPGGNIKSDKGVGGNRTEMPEININPEHTEILYNEGNPLNILYQNKTFKTTLKYILPDGTVTTTKDIFFNN